MRDAQNWLGRDAATPAGADFVPPPASEVEGLLADLCAYCSRTDVSPMLQGAVAHAQFETIHPWRFDSDGPDRWITFVAEAVEEAAAGAIRLADAVAALQAEWREAASSRRADASALALIPFLPAHPMITAGMAGRLLGRSYETGRAALRQLDADGVVAQVTVGRRNRAYETVGLFALVDELERELSGGAVATPGTH